LEEAVNELEYGELSLEKSLQVFTAGVAHAKSCRKALQDVELKVDQLLKQDDGSLSTEAFSDE
jgi:exodeoxyribonuclease VII small subunit